MGHSEGTMHSANVPLDYRGSVRVNASAPRVFSHLDDQVALAKHMTRRSLMMGGGRMTYSYDDRKGQAEGSVIRMGGSAFGIHLSVEEIVTERVPPIRKRWRTTGSPRMLILESYEMGFDIVPMEKDSLVSVWISYVPKWQRGVRGRIATALSAHYARWCVQRMLDDAQRVAA